MNLQDFHIDRNWTLFLDRDGVINRRIPRGYVTRWEDFEFLQGVRDAFQVFHKVFGKIIVVTNQQGIGKGLMTEEQLSSIHAKMLEMIRKSGGRIDRVYHSPYIESDEHPDRKPGTGMAFKAKKDFEEIDFNHSIMIGDSEHDMVFGRSLGMKTIWIGKDNEDINRKKLADFNFESLFEFSGQIK